MKPPQWEYVYPHGTPEGDDEAKFFIFLARTNQIWRTVSTIAKETGLTKKRVEEIIQKYHKKNMVFNSPKNEDLWCYFEKQPDLLPKEKQSIAEKDKEDRIKKSLNQRN